MAQHGEIQPRVAATLFPVSPSIPTLTPMQQLLSTSILTPTSSQPLPSTLSPLAGLEIPWSRMDVSISARWLVFVKDWEEGDKEHGLTMPLKDWNPAWKADPSFAMNYHTWKTITLEFIE